MTGRSVFPSHGRIICSKCFKGNEKTTQVDKWIVKNDPGAWGSFKPEILILGFSKGATQANIYESGNFDDIAFGGKQTRNNLTNIMRRVGLLDDQEIVDDKIRSTETVFAFGSLVRCSLSRFDSKTGNYKTSGPLINKSFREIPHIIDNCSQRFLKNLPQSLRMVIFLGTSDPYIKNCRETVQHLHPTNFQYINEVAYSTEHILWVHLTHPSKGNGTIKAWLTGNRSNKSGMKRKMAVEVIEQI